MVGHQGSGRGRCRPSGLAEGLRLVAAIVGQGSGEQYLDPDEEVAVGFEAGGAVGLADELRAIEVLQLAAVVSITDRQAHPRDVEKGKYAGFEALNRPGAKVVQRIAPGAAGVDGRGHTAPQAVVVDVHPCRGYFLVIVSVQVDEARHHQVAAGIVHPIGGRCVEIPPDRGNLSGRDAQVEMVIDSVGRIDEPAALYDPVVVIHGTFPKGVRGKSRSAVSVRPTNSGSRPFPPGWDRARRRCSSPNPESPQERRS